MSLMRMIVNREVRLFAMLRPSTASVPLPLFLERQGSRSVLCPDHWAPMEDRYVGPRNPHPMKHHETDQSATPL